MKTCIKCGLLKDDQEFHTRGGKQSHLKKSACKECHRKFAKDYYHKTSTPDKQRKSNLKKDFGITIEYYEELLKEQNGCCKICKTHYSEFSKRLAVDHDHNTGKIRGLLCLYCNTGLGKFKDSTKLLNEAIKYLEENTDGDQEV